MIPAVAWIAGFALGLAAGALLGTTIGLLATVCLNGELVAEASDGEHRL